MKRNKRQRKGERKQSTIMIVSYGVMCNHLQNLCDMNINSYQAATAAAACCAVIFGKIHEYP